MQELDRLIRDRDRLQTIIVRNGGSALLGVRSVELPSTETTPTRKKEPPSAWESNTTQTSEYGGETRKEVLIMKPTKKRSPLNWGTLSESINQEESALIHEGQHRKQSEVPDMFLLQECVEAAEPDCSSSNGLGIAANAERVGSYIDELEHYLEES